MVGRISRAFRHQGCLTLGPIAPQLVPQRQPQRRFRVAVYRPHLRSGFYGSSIRFRFKDIRVSTAQTTWPLRMRT
jgi:hypothetical protein